MASQVLHFRIDGSFMTEHCRNLVIEGRWDHAIRTLVQGLEGMTTDIALRILRGDAKLTGCDSELDLADDNAVEYKAALDYQFGGVFVDQWGSYFRPYGVVTSWGEHDLIDSSETVRTNRGSEVSYMKRAGTRVNARDPLHYADDPRTDIARSADIRTKQECVSRGLPLGNGEMILCRLMTNFPHMIVDPLRLNDVAGAVAQLAKTGRSLGEYGHSQTYRDEHSTFLGGGVAPVQNTASAADAEAALASARADTDRLARVAETLERTRERSIAEYRKIILAQAGDDLFDLSYRDGDEEKIVRVPTAPFENWALWRTNGADLAKPWSTVAPSGLKMQGDDPYHTDWMIGAGLPLDKMDDENSNLSKVAYSRMWNMQESLMSYEAAVLCGDADAYGVVVHPRPNEEVPKGSIAVIPSASPRYLAAAMTANGVIVEQGGSMAHLVSVARENGVLIMRAENALKRYPVGDKVLMQPSMGKIKTSTVPVRDAFGEFDE